MATLTDDEMARIKAELFSNVLDLGAVPYISVLAIYSLIRDNVSSSAVVPTTSATAGLVAGGTAATIDAVPSSSVSVSGTSQPHAPGSISCRRPASAILHASAISGMRSSTGCDRCRIAMAKYSMPRN